MGSLPRQGASLEEVSVKMGRGGMLQEQWEHGGSMKGREKVLWSLQGENDR